ncbi:uncharacterized protein LOC111230266 [Seriola dumerili]|uniref:uncharacterized protein LOC111230266 n=1 Tax=Seriola dumerili TaxID=41447 RepID=UPI000BBE81F8|nr:uncharacterized protein LOC111230266 [Seriola dumerili]
MVKGTSSSSGVRTQHVFGWVSIIWFTSAVRIAGSQDVKLQTIPQVAAQCGKNVTLTCNASSSRHMDIQFFSWLANMKNVCQYGNGQTDPGALCESTANTSHHTLTLTLINVMPVSKGKYLCKLRSNLGVKSASTSVTVHGCLEGSGFFTNESHAECWFTGVYPNGTIHWFQGEVNLTNSASTQEEMDQHGRYKVLSELHVEKGHLNLSYKCSLWIPSDRKYLSSQLLTVARQIKSSGSMAKLHWICIMVGIMMGMFMT